MRLTLLPAKTKTKAAIAAAILIILSQGVLPGLSFHSRAVSAAPAEGALVRIASNSAVYYVGRDGKRYVFPNEATYFSWYHNFDNVQVIGDGELANLPIGYLIPVRPNVRFVRFDGEAKVYAVEPGGLLRWIPDEATFSRFGFRLDQVVSLPDVFRPAYTEGSALVGAPNGVAVRSGQGGQLYYVRDGVKRPVTEQVLRQNRYFTNHIRVVAPEVIAAIPDGPSLGGFDQAVAGRPDDRPGAASVNPPPEQVPTSTAPNAPRNFSAVGGSQQVTLNWAAPSSGGQVVNYLLYRAMAPIVNISGSAVTPIASRPATTTNYSDAGLVASTTYYYAVRALGLNGAMGPYSTTSASTLRADAAVPPLPPTNLAAAGGSRQVALSWTLSATASVTNYAVYRSTSFFNQVDAPGVTAVATTSGSATSYTVASLASSTQYYFGVRARGGNGLYSALTTASASTQGGTSTNPVPPNPPTSFTATPTQQNIQLAWSVPAGPAVSSYQLFRSTSPITSVTGPGVSAVGTVQSPNTQYLDSGLSANTAYHYAVRSIDAAGLQSGIATTTATTGVADPNAPASLALAPGSSTVELRWAAPANASYPSKYQVYRSTSPVTPASPGTLVTTGNSTSWTTEGSSLNLVDVSLPSGATYYYGVRSQNAAGQVSSFTNAGPVTTAAAPAAVAMGGHPRVDMAATDISSVRQRAQPSGSVHENLLQTVNGQWSGGGYSRTDNLKGALVDYSSLDPASWTHSIGAATTPQQLLDSFTQWSNVISRGSLVALLTDDPLARQRATHALLALRGVYDATAATWMPDGSYPDNQPRQEAIKSMMTVVAVGYDRLYPWLTQAQRQQVGTLARQVSEKYRDFWIPDGFWAFPETHTHEDNAIYLRSLLAYYGDTDLLPADRSWIDSATSGKLSQYTSYLNWLAPFLQDGSGGATAYWGYYAYGEVSRMLLTVETIAVTANPSIYTQFPWLRNIVAFTAYTNLPNDRYVHTGNGGYGTHYNVVPISTLARRYGDAVAGWLADRFRTHSSMNQNATKEWGLLYDPNLPSQSPQQAGYGLDWFSAKAGLATMRSDWTDSAVVASIMNPPVARLQKLNQNAGSFTIYYRGPQVVQSGAYDIGSGSTHFVQYFRKTISSNTLTIHDPAEYFCDSRYHPAEQPCIEALTWNDGGQPYRRLSATPVDFNAPDRQMGTTVNESTATYNYTRADLTPAYRRYADASYSTFVEKASEVVREFVYVRPKAFVVLDRVTATDPSFTKRWLLHTESEPTVSGPVVSTQVPGHITTHSGDTVTTAASGQGRLFAKLLLPSSRTVKKVGGSGYEFYADTGINYPAWVCNPPDQVVCDGLGKWRLEVSPTAATSSDLFLNVIYVDDSGASSMPATQLLASADGTPAAAIAGTAVVFGKSSAPQSAGAYSGSGISTHIIAGLVPNASYVMTAVNDADENDVVTAQFSSSNVGTARVTTATPGTYSFSYVRQ